MKGETMKIIVTSAVVIMMSLLAPQVCAATPVKVALTLPHDHVLPGVPFDLVVTYTNVSKHPVTIGGARATLVVTFSDGATRVMHQTEGWDQWGLGSPHEPVRLRPGESAQQAASWEGGIPNWFIYGSFSGPGTYGIALDLQIYDAEENVLGNLRTPAVTLTRIEPAGIDGELWKRMQDISNGRWSDMWFQSSQSGEALAADIIQIHPSSGYYPYVLALRAIRRGKNHIAPLLEAAERFQASPAHPYLLNAAANCARYAGVVAAREGNLVEAKTYYTLAEAKYREGLATKSVSIRRSSEHGLQELTWRREQLKNEQDR
jgi:hypothetical protein